MSICSRISLENWFILYMPHPTTTIFFKENSSKELCRGHKLKFPNPYVCDILNLDNLI